MIRKGTKLYSIFKYKCPRCHEGEVFKDRNPYHLSKLFSMEETCSNCELKYEFEPGVFYGAMYVSYGLGVAMFVATFIIMNLIYEPEVLDIIIALSVLLIVLTPLFSRLSRIIWLNLFIKYKPEERGRSFK